MSWWNDGFSAGYQGNEYKKADGNYRCNGTPKYGLHLKLLSGTQVRYPLIQVQ
jgi:hypothetical protein